MTQSLAIAELTSLARVSGQKPAARARIAPESVETSMSYIVPTTGKPVIDMASANGSNEAHSLFETAPVEVTNGRWRQESFTLDQEGFALTHHTTSLETFDDDDEIRRVYYAEMEALLKRETGASRVLVFDHNVRKDDGGSAGDPDVRRPVRRIHNDYTASSGPKRLAELLGEADSSLLAGGDFAVVNVWKPIRGPVETAPLALADAQSVAPQDFVAADLAYAERTGEIYYANWNPLHRWVYFPDMEADEALLIKGYDSREDGRARFTLHTAFDDPTAPEHPAPRESIEIRALVFFD